MAERRAAHPFHMYDAMQSQPDCVARVLEGSYRGALTPAQAFGADFVLEIEGTERFDHI